MSRFSKQESTGEVCSIEAARVLHQRPVDSRIDGDENSPERISTTRMYSSQVH